MKSPKPINYFQPYQIAWINDPADVAVAEKSRRIGFTYGEAYRSVERRIKRKTNHYFASRDKASAGEFIDYCKFFAKVFGVVAEDLGETLVEDDQPAFVLRFVGGGRIIALSSSPNVFRSKGGDVTLDEFAFHAKQRDVLASAGPAVLLGDQLRIISTHNGEGSLFNSILKEIRRGERDWSLHRVTLLDAIEQGFVERVEKLPSRDDAARTAFVAKCRKTSVDHAAFDQEFLCIPGSDETSLLSYDLLRGCEAANLVLRPPIDFFPDGSFKATGELYAGYDVARRRNYSVLVILEKVGNRFWTRCVHAMLDQTFTAQEELLNAVMGNPAVRRLCVDATGMGEMLAERQVQRWGYRAEAVHFAAPVKSAMAMPLVRLFEDKSIVIPSSAEVREDLHKVRKTVTAAGNIRLDAANDDEGHADRFWACALAYEAADDTKIPLPPPALHKPVGW